MRASTALQGSVEKGFRLTSPGEFGGEYLIIGSTNLAHWLLFGLVINTCGMVQFTDTGATNRSRFYRAVKP